MRHHNTVFRDLINLIPWAEFDRLVVTHGSDDGVRRLDSKSQFLALLFGQIAGADSLRAIEEGMASQRARLYHLGARAPKRSTLADANASRPAGLFRDLFAVMVSRAGRAARRRMGDAVRILDATRLPLPGAAEGWKAGPKGVAAVKLHLVYAPETALPEDARITSSLVNDITPAKALDITPGTSYVFDLGYYSFDWWAKIHARNARFVTRLKTHTKLRDVQEHTPPDGLPDGVLTERTGWLAGPHGARMQDPVREIVVPLATGQTLRLVTNDLTAPAEHIARLYKDRWAIELFFRWLKQNLKIRRFIGTSQNAVMIQIFAALIAYLIIHSAYKTQSSVRGLTAFARLLKLSLWQRRPIDQLANPPDKSVNDHRQMTLNLQET